MSAHPRRWTPPRPRHAFRYGEVVWIPETRWGKEAAKAGIVKAVVVKHRGYRHRWKCDDDHEPHLGEICFRTIFKPAQRAIVRRLLQGITFGIPRVWSWKIPATDVFRSRAEAERKLLVEVMRGRQ